MNIDIKQVSTSEAVPMELLLEADPSKEMIAEYISRGDCFAALHDGVIAGEIVLMNTGPKKMEIMNIAVRKEYRYKGVGKRLIAFAVEKAKEEGARTLEIGTGNPGVQQLLLYQKCGFRIVGVDLDFFKRHYKEPIVENGLECRDMIRLRMEL